MRHSVVWYSQLLTPKIGMSRLQDYLAKFAYGNQDMSGNSGKNDGLTNGWLSSSLKISPREQVVFLRKLVRAELPVSPYAIQMTKNILFSEQLENGWKLFGKTGTGFERYDNGTPNRDRQFGWYVGWIERDLEKVIFALTMVEEKDIPPMAERRELSKQFLRDANILK
jgi:beta-lactamase class D